MFLFSGALNQAIDLLVRGSTSASDLDEHGVAIAQPTEQHSLRGLSHLDLSRPIGFG